MIRIEYKYIVAILYTCVLFLDRLDLTIVNVALPTLAHYFQVPITATQWVPTSFLLALAVVIPISAWLGEKFGTKIIFNWAIAIFGFSSMLCAFSPNLPLLVLFRFIQGLSGGMLIPVGMTILYRIFPVSEYASITSFTFIPTLIAPAIAPSIGGILVDTIGWKWIFLINAPICLLALLLAILVLKPDQTQTARPLDWQGFILSSTALILLLYSLSIISNSAFNLPNIAIYFLTLLLIFTFIYYELHTKYPLINLNYFRNTLFTQANLLQLTFQICHFASMFLIALYLQVGIGMSATASGIILGMQALGAICMSRYSVRMFHRYGPTRPIVIGLTGVAIITLLILLIHTPKMFIAACLILFIRGLFSGQCGTPIQTLSVIGFDKQDIGQASAIFNAGRQISISLGIALFSLIVTYGFAQHGLQQIILANPQLAYQVFHYAFFMIPVVACAGIFIALTVDCAKVKLMTADAKQ